VGNLKLLTFVLCIVIIQFGTT